MTKYVVRSEWNDVPHLSEEAKAGLVSSFQPHERDARTKGIPSLGAGAIYPVTEDEFLVAPFELPAWYRHVYALDVGWNRTAALWGALDPEADVLYLYSEHYRGHAEPPIHAEAIRARGRWIPGVIDPAARGRTQKDGEQLIQTYRALDLMLVLANNAVESGIYAVWTRLSTGRLKVFKTLQNFRNEYRVYRRDEKGHVVKENDHLMDCVRYLIMSGVDLSAQRPPEQWPIKFGLRPKQETDYNPLASAWNPQGQQSEQQTPRQWMPHKTG